MDELKNIRNFDEFKDSLNEELLLGALKNLFSKLFAKMDQKLAASVQKFTDRIDKSPNWETSVRALEESARERQVATNESIKNATGPLGLRKALADASEAMFLELQVLSNKYQSANLAAKNIFKGSPDEKMFTADNSEDFKANLPGFLNQKISDLSEGAYDKNALLTYLNSQTDMDKVETAPTNQSGTTNASASYNFTNKLYETNTNTTNNGVPQGDINKMKPAATNWVNQQILGDPVKKVKEIKAPAPAAGGGDPFDAIAKNTKATGNSQGLAKLLRNIVNIPDPNTLAKVRDEVGKIQKKDPTKFAQEIGKF